MHKHAAAPPQQLAPAAQRLCDIPLQCSFVVAPQAGAGALCILAAGVLGRLPATLARPVVWEEREE